MRKPELLRRALVFAVICGVSLAAMPNEQERSASPQPEPEMVIPAGTSIPIALSTFLNTRSSQVGDNFYADTTYPIWIQQRLVLPRGSVIKGTVTQVVRPGRVKGKGRIAIKFENVLLPNGVLRELVAELKGIHGPGAEKIDRQTETIEMDGSKGQDVGQVAGPASQGAIIGAIAGGGKGAFIGAGAGGAVGLATVLFSRGQELILAPGTQFDLVLMQPLRFAYGELQFTQSELNSTDRVTRTRSRYSRGRERPVYRPGGLGMPVPWGYPWP